MHFTDVPQQLLDIELPPYTRPQMQQLVALDLGCGPTPSLTPLSLLALPLPWHNPFGTLWGGRGCGLGGMGGCGGEARGRGRAGQERDTGQGGSGAVGVLG